MDNEHQIEKLVIDCVQEYLITIGNTGTIVTKETVLIGADAIIDSIGLVNIIVDIEGELSSKEYNILLTSEKAMSRKISPFRSINSIVAFIKESINER